MSLITPLGRTVEQNWNAILNSECAFDLLADQYGKCRIGGRLPDYKLPETSLNSKIHSLAKALAIDVIKDADIDLLG